ncbi:MAG: glycosyltransferase family 2 protein [Magnetococcales bacterium]|nr:glycosyltransferase family 2 protein [Magnetococcales bacterium]
MISIITPVYNSAEYLTTCLNSVLNQSYSDWELILIDDCSKDNSVAICQGFADKDSRVKLLLSENNSGPAAARNLGLKVAKGDCITFLDSDDILTPDALLHLNSALKESGADIVVGSHDKFNDAIQVDELAPEIGDMVFALEAETKMDKKQILAYVEGYLMKPNRKPLFTTSWSRLFRAEPIIKNGLLFDERLHTFEDVLFNFELLKHVNSLHYITNHTYRHRIRPNYSSATMKASNGAQTLFGFQYALDCAETFLLDHMAQQKVDPLVGHARVTYSIIQLIRYSGQLRGSDFFTAHKFIGDLLSTEQLRRALLHYRPTSPGESRLLPWLMGKNLAALTLAVCYYKAAKRYGRSKGG